MKALVPVALVAAMLAPFPDAVRGAALIVLLLLIGFFGWQRSMTRRHAVRGTATAKLATAAKGYAELAGWARGARCSSSAGVLVDPVKGVECVWYEVVTEKLNLARWRWEPAGTRRSSAPFALDDNTGLCLIHPAAARLIPGPPERFRERFRLRHKISRIKEHQQLYAIGHLERVSAAPSMAGASAARPPPAPAVSPEFERRVSALMREWKRNPAQRKQMFDPNGDGVTDAQEMASARHAARAQIARAAGAEAAAGRTGLLAQLRAAPAGPPAEPYSVDDRSVTHWMRRPDDHRPHIVTTLSEEELLRREQWRGLAFLALFAGIAFVVLVMVAERVGAL